MTAEKNTSNGVVPAVYSAINKVAGALASEGIAKTRRNQQQGYSFRGIDDVYSSLARKLVDADLCILPQVRERQVVERQSSKGNALFYVVVTVDFDFVCATDGSIHRVTTIGEAMDSADKATNKAMSAAYKYACLMTFCVPTVGDNDADATTHDVAGDASANIPPDLLEKATAAANNGVAAYQQFWNSITPKQKIILTKSGKHAELKAMAQDIDEALMGADAEMGA